jgi:hypothetical protein
MFATWLPGMLVPVVGYKPIFLVFGLFHLSGLFCLHRLMGEFRPVATGGGLPAIGGTGGR